MLEDDFLKIHECDMPYRDEQHSVSLDRLVKKMLYDAYRQGLHDAFAFAEKTYREKSRANTEESAKLMNDVAMTFMDKVNNGDLIIE